MEYNADSRLSALGSPMSQYSEGQKKLYEQRPYIYIIIGIVTLFYSGTSKIAVGSGVILVTTGICLYAFRSDYRKKLQEFIKNRPKD